MSLTKRGRNEWQIAWELGVDPATGKRRRVSERFHGTKAAALARYVERQQQLNQGIGLRDPHITVAELATEWLTYKRLQGKRPETMRGYEAMVRDYIVPQIGKIQVAELAALDVQRAIHHWATRARKDHRKDLKTISPRRVQYAFRTLSTMLRQAVRWEIVGRNVAEQLEAPTVPKKEAQWWTAEQAAQFLTVAQTHMHGIVWALALLTGMRKGELLGLRWADIDWDAGTLTVRQTQDSRHPKEFGSPKTDAGARTIKLDAGTLDLLKAHRTAQKRQRLMAKKAYQDWGLVCCTGLGTPLNPSNLNRDMNKLIAQAQVPKIRFHDLRHTHGTLLREQGTDFRVIANRLGHAQVSFTMQIYAHASTDAQAKPAEAVSRALLGGASPDKS